jgi:hypothetical protein
MPKAKLTFAADDAKKLAVAASFSNVTLGETVKIGKNIIVETSYRDPQSLINMMDLKAQVTGTELDKAAEPAKTTAAPAAAGKK